MEICIFAPQLFHISVWIYQHLFYSVDYNPVLGSLTSFRHGHRELFQVVSSGPLMCPRQFVFNTFLLLAI